MGKEGVDVTDEQAIELLELIVLYAHEYGKIAEDMTVWQLIRDLANSTEGEYVKQMREELGVWYA